MALPPITYRITKGAPLTHQEGDDNIRNLDERVSAAVVTVATIAPVAGNVPTAALRAALTVPSAPSDIGAATAAQGALAATAVQPAALAAGLETKVDKINGYGLSQSDYTQAEKDKLAGLEGSHYRGTFVTFSALESGVASPVIGDYADVDGGVGADVLRYIWDATDSEWVAQSGAASPITAAEVKTLYESNPDTNAFTDAEKSKLGGVAAGATANASNAQLRDRATHTGEQAISTITGLAAQLAALLANPMTTVGDIIIAAAGGAAARLGKGVDGQMLLSGPTTVGWSNSPLLAGYSEFLVTMASNEIDLASANVFHRVMTAASTFTFTGTVSANRCRSFTLYLEGGDNFVPTFPASVKWIGGAPTLTAKDRLVFETIDAGVTWFGTYSGSYV